MYEEKIQKQELPTQRLLSAHYRNKVDTAAASAEGEAINKSAQYFLLK